MREGRKVKNLYSPAVRYDSDVQTDIAAGYKIPNFSHRDGANEIVLIYGGSFAKVLQYISAEGREIAILAAIYIYG